MGPERGRRMRREDREREETKTGVERTRRWRTEGSETEGHLGVEGGAVHCRRREKRIEASREKKTAQKGL